MSNVSLQVDVGDIPSNSIAVLSSLQPLLKALSADNVHPLAVVELAAIGACFQISGSFAAQIPDFLVRAPSIRLERIAQWVGWHAGDTASFMSRSAGGQAASLLALTLIEYYEDDVGMLLHELSLHILPSSQARSSVHQLFVAGQNLAKKLSALGFGNHLALQVTRIREAYFNAGLDVPKTLLEKPTIETMVDFLCSLRRALQEESSILCFEGCEAAGYIVALVMALCPDDVELSVEGVIIFKGQRRSVVISVNSRNTTTFQIETILHGIGGGGIEKILSTEKTPWSPFRSIRFKWEGCLADNLDLVFSTLSAHATHDVLSSLVDLITAGVLCISGGVHHRIGADYPPLPRDAFRSLLGPNLGNRIRESLRLTFRIEPSAPSVDCAMAYTRLRRNINELIPSTSCSCGRCFRSDVWLESDADYVSYVIRSCKVALVWLRMAETITKAIAMIFVTPSPNTSVALHGPTDPGPLLVSIMNYVRGIGRRSNEPDNNVPTDFTTLQLHREILILSYSSLPSPDTIGQSDGSCTVFPLTLQNPMLSNPQNIEYMMVDGQFHDGQHYYARLQSSQTPVRVRLSNSQIATKPIIPSSLGTHSTFTMTVRPMSHQLELRTIIQIASKNVTVSWIDLHLAHMGATYADPCGHDSRDPCPLNETKVVLTNVEAPVGPPDCLSLAMTHNNPEAQFFCCVPRERILFQGRSCLKCTINYAKQNNYSLVIQS